MTARLCKIQLDQMTKTLSIIAIVISLVALAYALERSKSLGASISTTASSDTLETFRVNVNASLSSLVNDHVGTTTAQTFTALQKFFANASTTGLSGNYAQFGGTATTTLAQNGTATFSATTTVTSSLGVGTTTPTWDLNIGTAGATSTIMTGFFCMYGVDESGRKMYVKLALSGASAFSTSTSPCN